MELNFAPNTIQSCVKTTAPYTFFHSKKPPSSLISSSSRRNRSPRLSNRPLVFGSRYSNSRGNSLKRFCSSANFNEFSNEDLSKQIEELAQKFNIVDVNGVVGDADGDDIDDDEKEAAYVLSGESSYKQCENNVNTGFSMQFMPSKLELFEHNLLGIRPDWLEKDEIDRVNIEQKANCVDIPMSLRIIKRKQKLQEGIGAHAGDFANCSVKKAFSSLVFIIRELQSYAIHIRESLYCEDLKEIVSTVQREMNASFVWLFEQVFSRTPTLMVYVMILLANFTVHSMTDNAVIAASRRLSHKTITTETMSSLLTEEKSNQGEQSETDVGNNGGGKKIGPVGSGTEGGDRPRNVIPDVISEVSSIGNYFMTKEELHLWNSVVAEASRMQEESGLQILDREEMKQFVTSVNVEIEPEYYEDYFRTDLLYQMGIAEEPNNQLLLSNYAQFLQLVARDYDRAEECFKRAIQVEPLDAEALGRYADFLWIVRKDLWGAEEIYQQAMAADPNNPSHASKYASFLWSTGGEETCFPLSNSDSYDKVL